MGFNTALLILNDAIPEIDRDPKGWWNETKKQIVEHAFFGDDRHEYGFGIHGNGFAVITNHHADETALIAVGGNMANVLGRYRTGIREPGYNHHTEEGQAVLVAQWARDHGYELIDKA